MVERRKHRNPRVKRVSPEINPFDMSTWPKDPYIEYLKTLPAPDPLDPACWQQREAEGLGAIVP